LSTASGEILITDLRATRFNIRLEQAVRLVLAVLKDGKPGELWIPKLPSYRVVDLAEAIAPSIPHKLVGLRASEKVHELLITDSESPFAREFDDHYVITPNVQQQDGGWQYHSGSNTFRLNVTALKKEIEIYDKESTWTERS